jgi:hypothetical protein
VKEKGLEAGVERERHTDRPSAVCHSGGGGGGYKMAMFVLGKFSSLRK